MNPELSLLASTAAKTIVQLLTTDGWERLKSALGPFWGRSRPGGEATLDAQLNDSRAEMIAAGDDAEQVRAELTAEWQGRLRRLLAADPAIAAGLRRLLDEELDPALHDPKGANPERPDIRMRADVSGRGRAYQAGHDMAITER